MLRSVEIRRHVAQMQPGPLPARASDDPEATFEHLSGVLGRR